MKKEVIAVSSPDSIIINLSQKSYLFEKNAFNPEFLYGYITRDKFDEILKNCNTITEDAWKEKTMVDDININPKAESLMVISSIIALFYALFTLGSFFTDNIYIYGMVLISIMIDTVIIGGLAFYNFFRKAPKFLLLSEIFQIRINQYFKDEVNPNCKDMQWNFFRKKWHIQVYLKHKRSELRKIARDESLLKQENKKHRKSPIKDELKKEDVEIEMQEIKNLKKKD